MTQDDLNQIRAIMREEIASNNQTLSAALREEFAERLDAAVVALSTDFSELRQEMIRRFDEVNRRMDALERRMDRIAETNADIVSQLAALTRWANRLDRDNAELRNTQIAQQRVIDDLAKHGNRPPAQPPS
jgi:septal ring factor EnvC (AmiA/AmiB activator)